MVAVADERGSKASGSDGARNTIDDILGQSDNRRDLRRLPGLVLEAFRLVWAAAPQPFVLVAVLQVAGGLALAAQLLVVRRVLTAFETADTPLALGDLVPDLALFGALLVVVGLAGVVAREQRRVMAEVVGRHTTRRVMDIATRVDVIEYDRPSFYDRLQRARINASGRPVQIAEGVIGMLSGLAAIGAVVTLLVVIEPWLIAVIVVGAVPTVVLNRLSSLVLYAFAVEQTPRDRRRDYLYNVLTRKAEAHEVRAFDSAPYLSGEHDRLYDQRITALRQTARVRMLYGLLAAILTAGVTMGTIALLVWFVQGGRLSIADAAVALGGVLLLAGQVRTLAGSSGSLYEGALFLREFTDFLALERSGAIDDTPQPPVASIEESFGTIELRNVSFTYPSRTEPSLFGVDLTIQQGEVIALVGENGSGKTTLTRLLAGLFRPTSGTILWDGQDISEMSLAELRAHVTVIFQDFAKYFLTAQQNVAISEPLRIDDRAAVIAAAERAGAHRFLSTLPGGYESLLGPSFVGGSDLSVGQWQRVALARAYLRDAPLLILDEPTAAIDPRGELEIFEQVRSLAAGRTVVLVSHRFSSVRAADRIVVLQEGRIVEVGSHEQLLTRAGLYAELFRMQAEGYRVE